MDRTIEVISDNGVLRPVIPPLGVPEGQRLRVTLHEPDAPLDPAEYARRRAQMLQRMQAEGLWQPEPPTAEPPVEDWQPLVLEGEPLSEIVIKMRRGEI
jgi:hypothetical protein